MLLSAEILPSVINADNEMITEGMIGWIIWIYQIIKRTTNRTSNIFAEELPPVFTAVPFFNYWKTVSIPFDTGWNETEPFG